MRSTIFLLGAYAHAASGSRKQLSSLAKLLPWTAPGRSVGPEKDHIGGSSSTIDAFGGCFEWTSSRPDIITIGEVDADGNPLSWAEGQRRGATESSSCLPKVALYHAQATDLMNDETERSLLTATDKVSGTKLRAEIHVARIQKIELETSMRAINVGANETLRVKAYDSLGNVFDSLEGLRFRWEIEDRKTLRSVALGSNSYKSSPIRKTLQNHNEESDHLIVSGMSAGLTTVSVTLQEDGYEPLSTVVSVTVKEPIEILPPRSIVPPGGAFPLNLVKLDPAGDQVPVKLPDSNYSWSSSNADVSVSDRAIVCVASSASPRVDVRVAAVDNRGTSDGQAAVVIAQPTRMDLLTKERRNDGGSEMTATQWLIEGSVYYLGSETYDEKNMRMVVPENANLHFDCMGAGSDKRCGLIEVPEYSTNGKRALKATAIGEADLFLTWSGMHAHPDCPESSKVEFSAPVKGVVRVNVVPRLSFTDRAAVLKPDGSHRASTPLILPSGHSYALTTEGGSGYITWGSSDESVITITNDGTIKARPHTGRARSAFVTARDQYNPSNFVSIEVFVGEVGQIHVSVPQEELRVDDTMKVSVAASINMTPEELSALPYPDELKRRSSFLKFDACDDLSEKNLPAGDVRRSRLHLYFEGVDGDLTRLDEPLEPKKCSAASFHAKGTGRGYVTAAMEPGANKGLIRRDGLHREALSPAELASAPFTSVDRVKVLFPGRFLAKRLEGQRPRPRCEAAQGWPSCGFKTLSQADAAEWVLSVGDEVPVYFTGGPSTKKAQASSLELADKNLSGIIQIEKSPTPVAFPGRKEQLSTDKLFKVKCLKEHPAVTLKFGIEWRGTGTGQLKDSATMTIACSAPYKVEIAPLPFDDERRLGTIAPASPASEARGELYVGCGMDHEFAVFAWDGFGREIDLLKSSKIEWSSEYFETVYGDKTHHQQRHIKYKSAMKNCTQDVHPIVVNLSTVGAAVKEGWFNKGAQDKKDKKADFTDSLDLFHTPPPQILPAAEGILQELVYSPGTAVTIRTLFGSGRPVLSPASPSWTVNHLASSPRAADLATVKKDVLDRPAERALLAQVAGILSASPASLADADLAAIKAPRESLHASKGEGQRLSSSEWIAKAIKPGRSSVILSDPFVNGDLPTERSIYFFKIGSLQIELLDPETADPLPVSGASGPLVAHCQTGVDHLLEVRLVSDAGRPVHPALAKDIPLALELARPDQEGAETIRITPQKEAGYNRWMVRSDEVANLPLKATTKTPRGGSLVTAASETVEMQFYAPLSVLPSALVLPIGAQIQILAVGGPDNVVWSGAAPGGSMASLEPVQGSPVLPVQLPGQAQAVTTVTAERIGSGTLPIRLHSEPFRAAGQSREVLSGQRNGVDVPLTVASPHTLHLSSPSLRDGRVSLRRASPAFVKADPKTLDGKAFTPGVILHSDCHYSWVLSGDGAEDFAIVSKEEFDQEGVFQVGHSWVRNTNESAQSLKCQTCDSVAVLAPAGDRSWEEVYRRTKPGTISLNASLTCSDGSQGFGWSSNASLTAAVPLALKDEPSTLGALYGSGPVDPVMNEGVFLMPKSKYQFPLAQGGRCQRSNLHLNVLQEGIGAAQGPCLSANIDDECILNVEMTSQIGCKAILNVSVFDSAQSSPTLTLTSALPKTVKLFPNGPTHRVAFGQASSIPVKVYDAKSREVIIPDNMTMVFPAEASLFKGREGFPAVRGSQLTLLAPDKASLGMKSGEEEYCTHLTVALSPSPSSLTAPWSSNPGDEALTDTAEVCFTKPSLSALHRDVLQEAGTEEIARELSLVHSSKVYEQLLFVILVALIAGLIAGLISAARRPAVTTGTDFKAPPPPVMLPRGLGELPRSEYLPSGRSTPSTHTPGNSLTYRTAVHSATPVIGGLDDPYTGLRRD